MPIIALDFECEFFTGCDVKILGNANYARAAKAFLVALYCPELRLDYVGSVEDAPWEMVRAYPELIAHNAGFDAEVFQAAQDKGQIPKDIAPRWQCSADLSAYMFLGRALKDAVASAYQIELPKEIRNLSRNKKWPEDFSSARQLAYKEYCLTDARFSYQLWTDYHQQWPPEEQKFAEITRLRCARGVTIDVQKVKATLVELEGLKLLAEAQIPWATEGGPILSIGKVKAYCKAQGIIPPDSLAERSDACRAWEQAYGEQYPLVSALRQWRKTNIYQNKVKAMLARVKSDGRMPIGLKYFGAPATGRMAGTGAWNIQNLPRERFSGVDIRSLLVPAPGYKFVVADYQAIEPRVTAWICQSPILSELSKGHNIYESDARIAGLWDGAPGTLKKSDPILYSTIKVCTLGLGYGMGYNRLGDTARIQLGLDLSPAQAQDISLAWHGRNPGVRKKWQLLERACKASILAKETYSITLPSGRSLKYFRPEIFNNRFVVSRTLSGNHRRFYWGGTLFENVIQGIARDILRDTVLRLEAAGIPVVFTSHDEVVCEVPLDYDAREIEMLMLVTPAWAKGLPLGVELIEAQAYLK